MAATIITTSKNSCSAIKASKQSGLFQPSNLFKMLGEVAAVGMCGSRLQHGGKHYDHTLSK